MANEAVLIDFLMGCAVALFLVTALFFLKFWTRTRDQLFAAFAAAFAILAFERIILFLGTGDRPNSSFYLLRVVAFLLIGVAILRKNRQA